MILLAVDTSCDESCAAIVDTTRWRLLADVVQSHVEKMTEFGGIVPELASREHLKGVPFVIDQALKQAQLELDDIDWFAVTNRPGLVGALLVGVSYVKALAYTKKRPFSVINHVEAHLHSPLLLSFEGKELPPFPWVGLVVSGGHTELYRLSAPLQFEWLGGTLDDAAGEAFDKIGKLLGLGYPAGPLIDKQVRELASETMRTSYTFPRSRPEGLHFSFSGLKTSVAQRVKSLGTISDNDRLALMASAQEAILDPLVDRTREAQRQFPGSKIVVTGGVACNSRLRAKLPEAYFPSPRHCTDNAAMIALLAAIAHKENKLEIAPWDSSAHAQ